MAAAAAVTSNGGAAAAANGPSPGRLASVYSEVQTSRLLHALPLPSVLRSDFSVVDGPASSAAGNPGKFDSPDHYSAAHRRMLVWISRVLLAVQSAMGLSSSDLLGFLIDLVQMRSPSSSPTCSASLLRRWCHRLSPRRQGRSRSASCSPVDRRQAGTM